MVTRLPFPFDENEFRELWNFELWRLKKTVKTLQIGLYPVFLKNVAIKHVKEKEHSFISTSLQLQH